MILNSFSKHSYKAKQHRSSDFNNSTHQFSLTLPFSYAHLAAICRRKLLLEWYGKDGAATAVMLIKCHTVAQEDRKPELTLLIQAVDELNNMSKVKVTEWFGMNVKLFISYLH